MPLISFILRPLLLLLLALPYIASAQCPTLNSNATLTSPACTVGNTPCDLCPGDVMTLTATGSGLLPGTCVNWYYGTTPNFNPYNGQGTLMGCSEIAPIPPSSCSDCPILLSLLVNACGVEENNEYAVVWSGSGYYVDEFNLDYDAANNFGGPQNDDVGFGSCDWQVPNTNAVASVQTFCPNGTVVGAGPGDVVPANVPVIIFTSSNYNFNYNFGGLCPLAPVIYVMQSGCARTVGAFSNNGSNPRTTVVSLDCGCTSSKTYTPSQLPGSDGDFVFWTPPPFQFLPPVYGNVGCGFPNIPSFPGGGGNSPFEIEPFEWTVPQSLCNGGPYYVTGIIEPLPAGCPQTFTNYMAFDVPCDPPVLGTATVCTLDGPFDLTQLEDPAVQGGTWSGPGVSGNTFDPAGQSGTVTLTFTPDSDCSVPATTTITIRTSPTASFGPFTPVCAGGTTTMTVNLTGTGPWTFDIFLDGAYINTFTTSTTPFTFPITPSTNGTVSLDNFSDSQCDGPPVSQPITVLPPPQGTLNLLGSPIICAGGNVQFSVSFSGGSAPYMFEYTIDGAPQGVITTSNNPFVFSQSFSQASTIELIYLDANGCPGQTSGSYAIAIQAPTATLASGSGTLCANAPLTLDVLFTGQAPWTFQYAINGVPQPPITTSTTPYFLTFNPPTGTNTITLVSVVDGAGCTGDVFGSYTATVVEAPTAVLSGTDTICVGGTANLLLEFTGTPDWTVNYTINGSCPGNNCQYTTFDNPDNYAVTHNTPGTYVYQLTGVSSSGGCTGTASGTGIVEVLPLPTIQITSGSITLCSGQATMEVSFTGVNLPAVFTYFINGVGAGTLTATSSPFYFPVDYTPGTSVVTVGMDDIGACPVESSGSYTIIGTDPPTATLSGGGSTCGNTPVNLVVSFAGSGPYTFVYEANGANPQTITTSQNPFTFQVTPGSSTTYALVSVVGGGCPGVVSGTAQVDVISPPTATISGGGQICQGGNGTTLTFTFTGPGPYTFVYNAGNNNPQPPITTSDPVYTIPVNPPNGTIYTLASVTNGVCTGTVSGIATVFVFTPPTAVILGSSEHCLQADTFVLVDFTGTGPFDYVYAINGVPQPPVTTFNDPDTIFVNTNVNQQYILLEVNSPGCVGTVVGAAEITILEEPLVIDIVQNCDPVTQTYTVQFEVVNGTPPYSLSCGDGVFTGNIFNSAPIPLSDPYQICFNDLNNCGTVTVAEPSRCNCTSAAGTVNGDTLRACTTGTVTAIYNNNGFLDPDDVLGYVLHTYGGFPLGAILAYSSTPVFGFQAGMTPGVVYRISAVVGNDNGSGSVDLSDLCLSVSNGVPVVFSNPPRALAAAASTRCVDPDFVLPITFTGTPPFALTYSVNGQPAVVIPGIGGSSFNLPLPLSADVELVLQAADALCANNVADTVRIEVVQPPSWGAAVDNCNQTTGTFTLTVPLIGLAPFTVSGMAGTVSADTFTSDPLPFGQSYLALLEDASGCGTDTLSGTSLCACISDAGTMDSTLTGVACGSDTLVMVHLGNQVVGADDVFYFVLHTGPAGTLGTILDTALTPAFSFIPGVMAFGTTYFIAAIAESNVVSPDPCRSVSNSVPVVWRQPPSAQMTGDADVCSGRPTPIRIQISGTAPFNLSYTSNGNPVNVVSGQSPFIINATLLDTTLFVLTGVADANCPGTVSGSALINTHEVPRISGLQINCTPDKSAYTVSFRIIDGDLSSVQVAGSPTGNFNPATGVFTSSVADINIPFSYAVSDQWNCGTDTISGIAVCCETAIGGMPADTMLLCNDQPAVFAPATGVVLEPGDTLLYYLVVGGDPVSGTVLAISGNPVFVFNPGTMSPGTPYTVFAVAGPLSAGGVNLNGGCLALEPGPLVSWRPPVTAALTLSRDTVCTGAEASFVVQLSGGPSYSFTWQQNNGPANPVTTNNSSFSFTAAPPFSGSTYRLLSVSANGCTGTVSGTDQVVFIEAPFAVTNLQTTCDDQQQQFVLRFTLDNGPAPDPVYTVSGMPGALLGNVFTSAPRPVALGYNLVISTALGCTQTLSGTVTCVCDTDAGTLTVAKATLCTTDTLFLVPGGDAVLEPGDALVYILYANPADPVGSIILTSSTPRFVFLPGQLSTNTNYYVAAMAGNIIPGGGVNTQDPCLSISSWPGPVQFRNPPTALMTGDESVCRGSNRSFQVVFSGQAPFQLVYTLNGNTNQLTAPGPLFSVSALNIQQDQVYLPVSVTDQLCAGTVSGAINIRLLPDPSIDLTGDTIVCRGDSARIAITVNNAASATFNLLGGAAPIPVTNAVSGQTIAVLPPGNAFYFPGSPVFSGNACAPIPGDTVYIRQSDLGGTLSLTSYNGFPVSCFDAADGVASALPSGGIAPVQIRWSNGVNGSPATGLAPGLYRVTLTDAAGCTWSDSTRLTAPEPMDVDLTTRTAGCFGDQNGAIDIIRITGGVGAYTLTLNGNALTGTGVSGLGEGRYDLRVTDANGCLYAEDVFITASPPLFVEAGPDITISLGNSTLLDPIASNNNIVLAQWTPAGDGSLDDPNALRTLATPAKTTRYSIFVEDDSGCTASDSLTIFVEKSDRVYIPNVFNPGIFNGNERFNIFGGPELVLVRSLRIFDRWGNMVYEGLDLTPNEPILGWDGTFNGKDAPPAVYVYTAEVEFLDGSRAFKSGDLTLIR